MSKNLNERAKDLLNFQITWNLVFFVGYIGLMLSLFYRYNASGDINMGMFNSQYIMNIIFIGTMYIFNFLLIIVNSVRLNNDKKAVYFPKIRFLKTEAKFRRQLV